MRYLIIFLCFPLFANEFQELSKVSTEYLAKFSNEKEEKKWLKSYEESYEQAIKDNLAMDEQIFFQRKIINWVIDKKNKIKSLEKIDDKTLLEGCRYFSVMKSKKLELPSQIKEEFTEEKLNTFLDFLKKKI